MSAEEPMIEIEIRGGMIATVRTRDTIGAVSYQVVDYDTDGADDDDTDVDAAGDRYSHAATRRPAGRPGLRSGHLTITRIDGGEIETLSFAR